MMKMERIWKEAACPNLKVQSRHSPGATEKNHETPQDRRTSGRDLSPGLHD
jgi:hypothetical protein